MIKFKKIIILGSQGSGKSTQAKLLAEKIGVPYIEMGQLLRDRMQNNNPEAGEIREAIKVGNLVPEKIVIRTLQARIKSSDCQNGFVLDGFPRNYAQLEGLPKGIDKVFFIKISDQEAIRRLIDRARYDDNLNVIQRRLALYHRQTEPLLAYFRQEGILEEVDGHATIEEIQEDIVKRLSKAK